MAAIFVGGVVRRDRRGPAAARSSRRGILCASGFVAGEGLAGVLIAGYAFVMKLGREPAPEVTTAGAILGLAVLIGCAYLLLRATRPAPAGADVGTR